MNRRLAIQFMLAGTEFWNRKPAGEWADQEIARLLHDSPWAKDVNADFETDGEPDPLSAGRAGVPGSPARATRHRQPVIIVWESAAPVLQARHAALTAPFAGRYVISAAEIPVGVMERRRRPDEIRESALEMRQRMAGQLTAAATLEARGKSPVQPGVVDLAPRTSATWLFGFSRELLNLDRDDQEVIFTLKTAFITLRAKFELKKMVYRGVLVL